MDQNNLQELLTKHAESHENATRVAQVCSSDAWTGILWLFDRLEEYWKAQVFSRSVGGVDDLEFARYVKDYKMKIEALAEIYSNLQIMIEHAGRVDPIILEEFKVEDEEDAQQESARASSNVRRGILERSKDIVKLVGEENM